MMGTDAERLCVVHDRLRTDLLACRNARGFWEGRLSSSALATGVAIVALHRVDAAQHDERIAAGLRWLLAHVNEDGGWGDSPESPSNLTATLLCWAALRECGDTADSAVKTVRAGATAWLDAVAGGIEPDLLREAVRKRYGADLTFAGPILTMLTLTGCLGEGLEAWRQVPQLPFELAVLPAQLFRWLRLSVVSYALPALIAVGLVRHRQCPSRLRAVRWLRDRVTRRALAIAEHMQPPNGGYEEATPITAFVTMCLLAAGESASTIVQRAVSFLCESMREDGGWPIDTNLATWVSTLSVGALADGPLSVNVLEDEDRQRLRGWLLAQQETEKHPLTSAAPGGWGWSDLPGSMPDADDTSGVLLALRRICAEQDPEARSAAQQAIVWLLDLQNRDGGMPTFTRGWGKLPFDRSCPDITAHALRAFSEWREDLLPSVQCRVDRAVCRGIRFLGRNQNADGSWTPLWFGNQFVSDEVNRTYGTAQTVIAVANLPPELQVDVRALIDRGAGWLVGAQNPDGGWGGGQGAPSSIEETALAVRALCRCGRAESAQRGVEWLLEMTQDGAVCPAAPIGLYFARLWYSEALYPRIFTLHALSDWLLLQSSIRSPQSIIL